MTNKYTVHKFGGSSLANANCIQQIKQILTGRHEIIIVSALKGVTSALGQLIELARTQRDYAQLFAQIQNKHVELIQTLLAEQAAKKVIASFKSDWETITNVLQAINLVKSYSVQAHDLILSYGEKWSAKLLTSYLSTEHPVSYVDASKIIFIEKKHHQTFVNWDKTQTAFEQQLKELGADVIVITGFIASNLAGQLTTLGRNGSDFSSAIIAKLIDAKHLTIWKDVDGIYSADPSKVSSAFILEHVSYEEAYELAYFGATVIHPDAIAPAMESKIPIYIKNTFNPQGKGTKISAKHTKSPYLIQGLTSIDNIALINIEGTGMMGIPGIAAKVFDVLQQNGISVSLISQASSEHSICLAIHEAQSDHAVDALNEYFSFEIKRKQLKTIEALKSCAILAAVGDSMVGTPGILGKLCYSLSLANINIRAIAQGSTERNISVVVSRDDIGKALRTVHAAFYLSNKTISIGLIGPGVVGSALLEQIQQTLKHLQDEHKLNLRVRGIMSSKKMILENKQIDLENWRQQLLNSSIEAYLPEFVDHILADDVPHAVIIDCTASQTVADQYINFIERGVHIITPNKRANSSAMAYYQQLKAKSKTHNRFYLYETTVCAGLPVIKTLQDLIQTGDEIIAVEGVVSGTLSYIFNELAQGKPFSSIIKTAKQLGYTEPDPRDDLSGMDVARKFVCLAREMGINISLEDIEVENLVPEALRTYPLDTFFEKLPEFDQQIENHLNQIKTGNERLAYVGLIKTDAKANNKPSIDIGIQAFAQDHPFAQLSSTDCMMIFHTQRYLKQALVIQGPGAGAEVTAGGVFADLLRLGSSLST